MIWVTSACRTASLAERRLARPAGQTLTAIRKHELKASAEDRKRSRRCPYCGGACHLASAREPDVDDRLRHPIDPEEEDGYGSSWRREWDGRRYHTREHLTAGPGPAIPALLTAATRGGAILASHGSAAARQYRHPAALADQRASAG